MKQLVITVLAFLLVAACSSSNDDKSEYTPKISNTYTEYLSFEQRPKTDKKLDSKRLPDQVLNLINLKPGMQVLDYLAGTGYYTELFSYRVGSSGTVFLHNAPAYSSEKKTSAIDERLSRLKNIKTINSSLEVAITQNDLDVIFLSKVLHDFYVVDKSESKTIIADTLLASFYNSLNKGGQLIVIDHAAAANSFDLKKIADIHRIPRQFVIDQLLKHNFKLVAESNILSNPADNGTLNIWDAEVRGKTNKFILIFEK